VLLAPGDTFRAAAAEQLAAWAKRCGAQMGAFKEGGRPGGVLAAACNDAKQRRDVDVVICDTGVRGVVVWCGVVCGRLCGARWAPGAMKRVLLLQML
jgi:hypothetical protein